MLTSQDYQSAAELTADLLNLVYRDEGDESLFREVLRPIQDQLRSPIGVCGYLDDDGRLVCESSDGDLSAAGPPVNSMICLQPEDWSGSWKCVLQDKRTHYHNSSQQLFAQGPHVNRMLGAPIVNQGQLVGAIQLANRDEDYGERDAEWLDLVLRPLAPALQARLKRRQDRRQTAQSISNLEREVDAERQAKQASQNSLRRLQQVHQQILDGTPAVIYMKDLAGEYEFVNRRFEELFHVTRGELAGKDDFDLFPRELAEQFRTNDVQVAQSGQPLKIREVAQHDDGPHTYLSIKFPLRDSQGAVCSVAGISTDITEQDQIEREVAQLSRQKELILDAVGDGVIGIDRSGKATFINPTATTLLGWTVDDIVGEDLCKRLGHDILPLAAASGADIVLEDEGALFSAKSGEFVEVRFVSRPLIVDGRADGAVITFRGLADERLREAGERLQREAEQRQFEQDRQLRAIRNLQLDLFPQTDPHLAGYEIAGRNFPHQIVSGDFFDYVLQPDGSLITIVGDATGHDLTSAVHMVEAHAVLHTLLDCGIPLNEMLMRLNQTLCRHLTGRFVTLFVLRLDPKSGQVEFAGAGHDATLIRASGKIESLPSTGLVLGLEASGQQPTFATAQLDPGDLILLLTDGFQEASSPDKKLFGRKRIFDAVKTAWDGSLVEVISHLKSEVDRFSSPRPPQDDMTAVIMRRSPE